MYLIAIAWMYVVIMMALAEALSAQGTVLGALFTLLLYGCLPVALVMYLLGTPMRRRARRAAEAAEATGIAAAADVTRGSANAATTVDTTSAQAATPAESRAPSRPQPDGGGHAAGDAVAPERKEA